jgi:predicted nucleic acid-binding protein
VIVLDTNVLSETLRPKPADSVKRWMEAQPAATLFTTTICEAEILYGLALLPTGRRRAGLERAVAAIFEEELSGRILPFDSRAARAFAEIAARRRRSGRPIGEFDAQIAAIASAHGAAVATRNAEDFADCRVKVISPWEK